MQPTAGAARAVPGGVRLRLSPRPRLRCGGRLAHAEGREQFRRYWESAIDVPGPARRHAGRLARANRLHLVVGVVERERRHAVLHGALLRSRRRYLGKHRKLMPTPASGSCGASATVRRSRSSTPPLGKLGAVICWENYMPLLRTAMYAKGVEIYCAPTADARDTWLPTHAARRAWKAAASCSRPTSSRAARTTRRLPDRVWRRSADRDLARRQLHHRPAR